MMKQYIIFILTILFFINLYAAEELLVKGDMNLTPESTSQALNSCMKQIKTGDKGKPLPLVYYSFFSGRVDKWYKYKYFEADTGYTKGWILTVKKYFDYMGQCANFCDLARANKTYDTPATDKVKKNFLAAYKKLQEIIDNPVKVDKRQLRVLRRKKQEWLKYELRKLKEKQEYERRRNGGR